MIKNVLCVTNRHLTFPKEMKYEKAACYLSTGLKLSITS